jgi:two-component system, chemotaxis family, CheB/CheR fusion protein
MGMAEKRKTKRTDLRQHDQIVLSLKHEFGSPGEKTVASNGEFRLAHKNSDPLGQHSLTGNEELTRVNLQLKASLDRERRNGDDLKNILKSSDIATLIVDSSLNIRFFTPHAAPLFGVASADAGRPLIDLAIRFTDVDLISDARAVLESSTPIKRETKSASGSWYLCTISPYRTRNNRIEGVVINLNDISKMRAVEEKIRDAKAYANSIIETIHRPLVVLDPELRVKSASPSFYRFFDVRPEDTLGHPLPKSGARLDTPELRALLDRIKYGNHNIENFEFTIDLPAPLGKRILTITADEIRDADVGANVLISFDDITDFKLAAEQLSAAKQTAEQANVAKSRFLAAASHDLRQPLQTLSLLHGTLKQRIKDDDTRCVLGKAERVSEAMVSTLNAILDIDQLETGAITPTLTDFPINELLDTVHGDFLELARNKRLSCRVVRCGLTVRSDRRLLEEIVRNLLSNAVRYTERGKILLGCRRRRGKLYIEVWDTGTGVSEERRARIFEEYHRGTDATRQGGLGLGLAIVQRLGELLTHPIGIRSWLGKGSVFSVNVPVADTPSPPTQPSQEPQSERSVIRAGVILVIEDEPSVRQSLEAMLVAEGHRVRAAVSGQAALEIVTRHGPKPDLLISDYNLPGEPNGVQIAETVRSVLGWQVPVIILSGDVRARKLPDVTSRGYVSITKPAKAAELSQLVQQLLTGLQWRKVTSTAASPFESPWAKTDATIFIVDDDRDIRDAMRELLANAGYRVKTNADAQAFLNSHRAEDEGCLIVDVRMPGMNGLEMLARLAIAGNRLPAIVITGKGDIAMAVQAMRAGAADFIEKPVNPETLLAAVDRVLRNAASPAQRSAMRAAAAMRIASLTKREREVMGLVVLGYLNKEIAARLGINQRTVEVHRAAVMKKTGASSLSELVRFEIAAHGGQ